MADSKLKMEIEKLKNNANVDEGLKQVVLELENEVVQFENRIKKIIEKANNRLLLSSNQDSNSSQKQTPIKVNDFKDIEEDDLWIPKELLSDEVKVPEMDSIVDNSDVDFMSLINKSTPGKNSLSQMDIIEPMEERLSKKNLINQTKIHQFKSFTNNPNISNFDANRSIRVATSDNNNFTISRIKQNENIQKINFAIERNNESNNTEKKLKYQPLHTQVIKNIEKTNDIDSQYKGILSRHSLNKDLKEFNYILKRRDIDDFGRKRRPLSKTRIIKLNSSSLDNQKNDGGSFSKTIRISFNKNK